MLIPMRYRGRRWNPDRPFRDGVLPVLVVPPARWSKRIPRFLPRIRLQTTFSFLHVNFARRNDDSYSPTWTLRRGFDLLDSSLDVVRLQAISTKDRWRPQSLTVYERSMVSTPLPRGPCRGTGPPLSHLSSTGGTNARATGVQVHTDTRYVCTWCMFASQRKEEQTKQTSFERRQKEGVTHGKAWTKSDGRGKKRLQTGEPLR